MISAEEKNCFTEFEIYLDVFLLAECCCLVAYYIFASYKFYFISYNGCKVLDDGENYFTVFEICLDGFLLVCYMMLSDCILNFCVLHFLLFLL